MKPTVESIDDKIQQSIEKRYSDTIVSHQFAVTIIEDSFDLKYKRGINYGKLLFAITNLIKAKDEHVFEFLTDSYEYFRGYPKEIGYLMTLDGLGRYHDYTGDYEKALSYLEEGVIAAKGTEYREFQADILSSLGKVYMRLNNYEDAIQVFYKSFNIRKQKGLKAAQASSLNLLGRAYTLSGAYDKAIRFYEQSINLRKELNDIHGIVWCYIGLASMFESEGDNYKSIFYYKKALDYTKGHIDQMSDYHIAKGLGEICLEHADYEQAKKYIMRLLDISEKISSKPLIYKVYRLLANYYEKTNQFKKAVEYFNKYINLKEEVLNMKAQNRIAYKQTEFEIINAKKESEIFQLKNVQLKKAYENIEAKNKKINEDINYAYRVQMAFLPHKAMLQNYFNDFFICYKPKEKVSGDFYWFEEIENDLIFAAADSTFHGIPGVFMSILSISYLYETINNVEELSPGLVLNKLREKIIQTINQEEEKKIKSDVIDMGLCIYDKDNRMLDFSGAFIPLYLIRDKELTEYKADQMPIGLYVSSKKSFSSQKIPVKENDLIYLFSDGFIQQLGGKKGEKYPEKQFKEFLLSISDQNLSSQRDALENEFYRWKGKRKQSDDIIIMGFRI
jgi:serine phosphatase RsbU (regulator of sigma subunit)